MSSLARAVLVCQLIGAAACVPTVIVVQDTAGLHTGDTGVARTARDALAPWGEPAWQDTGAVFGEGALNGQSMP